MILVGLLFLYITFTLAPSSVSACDCDVPDDALEGLEKSDAVFTGKVKDIKKVKINGEPFDAVLVEVNEIWKGIQESEIVIYTTWSNCQFEFDEGEEYLLYSYRNEDRLYVSICGRSTTVSHGSEDIKMLGPGKTPDKEVNLEFESVNWKWIVGLITIVVVFSLSALFIVRHLRKRN